MIIFFVIKKMSDQIEEQKIYQICNEAIQDEPVSASAVSVSIEENESKKKQCEETEHYEQADKHEEKQVDEEKDDTYHRFQKDCINAVNEIEKKDSSFFGEKPDTSNVSVDKRGYVNYYEDFREDDEYYDHSDDNLAAMDAELERYENDRGDYTDD